MASRVARAWASVSAARNACATSSTSAPRRVRAPSSLWRVGPSVFTAVADRSQVAEARRLVGVLAGRIGLPPGRIDQVAIVVTELATNLLKHGGGGHIHAIQCD